MEGSVSAMSVPRIATTTSSSSSEKARASLLDGPALSGPSFSRDATAAIPPLRRSVPATALDLFVCICGFIGYSLHFEPGSAISVEKIR